MNNQETRHLKRAVKRQDSEDGNGDISGTGAVFFDENDLGTQFRLWEGAFERIMPGAFTETLRNEDVFATFNHNLDQLLGRSGSGSLELAETSVGLEYNIRAAGTTIFRDVAEMIERDDIKGSSIWFSIPDPEVNDVWRTVEGQEIREIRQVQLFEVGPVTNPAYPATEANIRDLRTARENLADRKLQSEKRRRQEISLIVDFLSLDIGFLSR